MKYLDTSALVKYYGNPESEIGVDKISDLIERSRQGKGVLLTSILTLGEVVSAFDRWRRIKIITDEDLSTILAKFFTDIEELNSIGGLIVDDINSLSIMFSIEHILKHNLPINDSLHIYTALKHRQHTDLFISSDQNQLIAAKKEGFVVWNPEK